jgi:hypothetical protein
MANTFTFRKLIAAKKSAINGIRTTALAHPLASLLLVRDNAGAYVKLRRPVSAAVIMITGLPGCTIINTMLCCEY